MDNKELSNEELKLLIEELKKENEKLKYQIYEKCILLDDMLEEKNNN